MRRPPTGFLAQKKFDLHQGSSEHRISRPGDSISALTVQIEDARIVRLPYLSPAPTCFNLLPLGSFRTKTRAIDHRNPSFPIRFTDSVQPPVEREENAISRRRSNFFDDV